MLARLDPRASTRVWFPLGEQDKDATRGEAAARGARGREARREPGGVLPRRRRLPRVPRAPRDRTARRRRSSTSTARRARRARRLLALHAGSAARVGVVAERAAVRARHRRGARTPSSSARTSRSRAARVAASRPALCRRRPRRREAPLPLARRRRARVAHRRAASTLELDEPAYGVARGQAAVLYEGDAVVGCGTISAAACGRIGPDARRRIHVGGSLATRARRFPARRRPRLGLSARAPGRNRRAPFRVHHRERSGRSCP